MPIDVRLRSAAAPPHFTILAAAIGSEAASHMNENQEAEGQKTAEAGSKEACF